MRSNFNYCRFFEFFVKSDLAGNKIHSASSRPMCVLISEITTPAPVAAPSSALQVWMYARVFRDILSCLVKRPCDGLTPVQGVLPKCLKGFRS